MHRINFGDMLREWEPRARYVGIRIISTIQYMRIIALHSHESYTHIIQYTQISRSRFAKACKEVAKKWTEKKRNKNSKWCAFKSIGTAIYCFLNHSTLISHISKLLVRASILNEKKEDDNSTHRKRITNHH